MPDGTTSMIITAFNTALDGLKFVWVALMGLIVWNGRRLVKQVDELDKETIRKDDFNNTLASLRGDIQNLGTLHAETAKGLRADLRDDLKGVHSRIDDILAKK